MYLSNDTAARFYGLTETRIVSRHIASADKLHTFVHNLVREDIMDLCAKCLRAALRRCSTCRRSVLPVKNVLTNPIAARRIENLRATMGLVSRDAHVGHHLIQPLVDRFGHW